MLYKLLKYSTVPLLGLSLTQVHAQTLNVKEKNETQTSYSLSNIRKLTFSQGNLIITTKIQGVDSYPINGLLNLNFNSIITDIPATLTKYPILNTYPNPLSDVLNINLSETTGQGTLEILNTDGIIVKTQQIESTASVSIDLSQLPLGLYLCRYNNGIETRTTKIIKH